MNLMWRLMHGLAIAALIGSAAYVYGVKYQTIYASEQLVKTRHLIDKEKDAISLLRAEYAHLARPDRVQALADSKLALQPLALSQIAAIDELPDAQPKIDSIGRTLESLGFTADNSTPAVTAADFDASGEVREWPQPRSIPARSPRPANGSAIIPQMCWLTRQSRGCGECCRRISASISGRTPSRRRGRRPTRS